VKRRWIIALAVWLVGCGGKLLDEDDAGDANVLDGSTGDVQFVCGQGNVFVVCDPDAAFCDLVKTSKTEHYSCGQLADSPCASLPVVSSPGQCGCYTAPNGFLYVTECQ